MEPRIALTTNPLITEIVANNRGGILDNDGDRSDWVEIFNPSDQPIDLTGHFLTDEADNLTKWQFPDVTIGPRDYQLIFASGKNRVGSDGALHTSFRLDRDGESVLLVAPDGQQIVSAVNAFPAQRDGTAYGVAQQHVAQSVVSRESPVQYLAPTVENGGAELEQSWTHREFDASHWQVGAGSVGFGDTETFVELVDTNIQDTMHQITASLYTRYEFHLANVGSVFQMHLEMYYEDGFVAYLNGFEIARQAAPDRLKFDSQSSVSRVPSEVDVPVELNLSTFIDQLVTGNNVLAIHGLNRSHRSDDFLLGPTLSISVPGPLRDQSGHLASPTPGEPNGDVVYSNLIGAASVSLSHGFYDTTQHVELTHDTPGASIVYTLNGSAPSWQNGHRIDAADTESTPIANLVVDKTTTLRVIALKDDALALAADTYTYFFVDDVIRQSPNGDAPQGWPVEQVNDQIFDYGMDPEITEAAAYNSFLRDALLDIPSVSIVTDRSHLFDPKDGIFVNGIAARGENEQWERPASIELIHPDGTVGFQIDAGLRMRGGASRRGDNPKHAFRVFFRSEYGEPKLEYPLFGDEGAAEFDNIDFRTEAIPSWSWCIPGDALLGCAGNTFLRDVFSRDTQRDMGQPYTRSRYYHLYLNGQYWGLYQSQERAEASYGATYFGGQKEDYDVIKVEGFPHRIAATDGTIDAWQELWEIAVAGLESDESYFRLQGRNPDGTRNPDYPVLLDVDNLIDYVTVILYTGNLDAAISNFGDNLITNNWFGVRNRNLDEGFRFFAHDSEWTLMDVDENRLGPWSAGNEFAQSNPQWLHQQLTANEQYRVRFADRIQTLFFNQGPLSIDANLARLQSRSDEIDLAIIAESARWGDAQRAAPFTREDWLAAVADITDVYMPQREAIFLDQLRSYLPQLFPDLAAPHFNQLGGTIDPGFELTMTADAEIYFTLDGSDPRAQAATIDFQAVVTPTSPSRFLIPADEIPNNWPSLDFDDTSWQVGQAGIGFQVANGNVDTLIEHDVAASMSGVSPSALLRIPFDVPDPNSVDVLQMLLHYDDGFVAYLNGTEVARANAPDVLDAEARATNSRTSSVTTAEVLELSSQLQLLQPGENLLAIQGLNRSPTNKDFLIRPEFRVGVVEDSGLADQAVRFTSPIELDGNVIVSARTLSGSQWSPLTRAVFELDRSPLRIDELMYHPSAPTPLEASTGLDDDDAFEFIEIVNTSTDQTVNLENVKLAGAIDFIFSEGALSPGERIVVAKDETAFQQRYGDVARLAGSYGGRLSNRSDSLQLVDGFGLLVQEVSYEDEWYADTDGGGHSLVVRHESVIGATMAEGWRASRLPGGTPGSPPTQIGDANGDGIFDSMDLVDVLASGRYGQGEPATYEEGDWNQDGRFDSEDIVFAFIHGRYTASP